MLRQHLFDKRAPADPLFRWRGGDVSRLEALSDGVFALAIAMLILSVKSGQHFSEIWRTFSDLPAHAVSFAMLMMLWNAHHRFFRRYGLEDLPTIVLNAVLLFLVLFYAFPLQFLWLMLWRGITLGRTGIEELFADAGGVIPTTWIGPPAESLLVVYSGGFVAIFTLFLLMTWRAWCVREKLELDALEEHLTKSAMVEHGIMMGVGLLSVTIALTVDAGHGTGMWAGMVYFLLGPLQWIFGVRSGRKAERLKKALSGDAPR